jgi:predicted DCC family thiol-disulfide oxidoreductase YuxK
MTHSPHSYRAAPAVPEFDDTAPIVIFDGHCVLCSAGVQWMLRRDPSGTTRFAAIQEPVARALYLHYALDPDRFDTFMVLANGLPHTKWAGALAAARTMPAPWRWLGGLGRLVPEVIGDRIYDWVQRNRIGWFGARQTCFLPDARTRVRLLSAPASTATEPAGQPYPPDM